MKNRTLKLLFLTLFILCIISSCSKKQGAVPEGSVSSETDKSKYALSPSQMAQSSEPEKTTYAVTAYHITPENMDAYLEFGGDVVSETSVDILPEMAGKLTKLSISVGDTVKKNQIVGYVDPSRPGMTYIASPIKAPIAGTIVAVPFSEGSTVSQSTSVGKISLTNGLEINMNVAERFISRIELNQTAYLTFDAYPEETFTAKVTEMSPVLDTSTRTMAVTLKVTPPDKRIKAGMYARIKLITQHKANALVIPYEAIVSRSGETFVFTVSNGVAHKQNITTGIRVDNMVEVLTGLSAGLDVITKGQTLLNEGSLINVVSTLNSNR